jgi:dienelactone hydrolase
MVTRERVEFRSEGIALAGYMYFPEAAGETLPCVVLCHGFSGTMDRLFPHAERFAAEGLAALVFDYRTFGDSGGDPRQVVDVHGQQEDVRSAVAFARAHARIDADQVALWGNSLGGAHAITVASKDPRVPAVVSQIPFNGFPKKVVGRSSWDVLRLRSVVLWDALRARLHLPPHYIPMLGAPGELAVTTTEEAEQHIRTLSGAGSTLWRNAIAPRGLISMASYRPAADAASLQAPLFVCIAADDHETPEDTTRALVNAAPRGELRRYPGTHFSFYNDPEIRSRVLGDQIRFFRKHLAPGTAQEPRDFLA